MICNSCGHNIGEDEKVSIMQINIKPGGRTFKQFNLCEKCHSKVMALLATANTFNAMANKG